MKIILASIALAFTMSSIAQTTKTPPPKVPRYNGQNVTLSRKTIKADESVVLPPNSYALAVASRDTNNVVNVIMKEGVSFSRRGANVAIVSDWGAGHTREYPEWYQYNPPHKIVTCSKPCIVQWFTVIVPKGVRKS